MKAQAKVRTHPHALSGGTSTGEGGCWWLGTAGLASYPPCATGGGGKGPVPPGQSRSLFAARSSLLDPLLCPGQLVSTAAPHADSPLVLLAQLCPGHWHMAKHICAGSFPLPEVVSEERQGQERAKQEPEPLTSMLLCQAGIYSQAQGEVTQAPALLSLCVSLQPAAVCCYELVLLLQPAHRPLHVHDRTHARLWLCSPALSPLSAHVNPDTEQENW